jgi:hypothetical protein
MTNEAAPICREHSKPKEWLPTTFEYSEDDISVRIPGVYAWVCTEDGDASFTPETVDELLLTVRDLLESAKRAKGRRSSLTEYIISVG